MTNEPVSIVILIFDGVEVLDFCGPFEVFSVANRETDGRAFNVYTVAETKSIETQGGLSVIRTYSLDACPAPDVLLIPGGNGVNRLLDRQSINDWVKTQAAACSLLTSVCTGAVLLGRCGLLDGLEVTTHHRCLQQLRDEAPKAIVRQDRRYIDTGRVITSAGISAGIDMSLHVVRRFLGIDRAHSVAQRMEYRWENSEAER